MDNEFVDVGAPETWYESPKATQYTPNTRQVGGAHYKSMGVQPWDAMESWLSLEEFQGFLKGNAIKYLARAGKKAGLLSDVQKAQHYLEKLIEVLEKRGVRE